MGIEIERKFLINFEKINKEDIKSSNIIKQGYLPTTNNTVVRVRISENKGYLTIKGENNGITRSEFEYEIPLLEAEEMISQFCSKLIEKERFNILIGEHNWEVDVFKGDNEGLIIAEIELSSVEEKFVIPEWVIKEVTDDNRYYNNQLLKNPFKSFKD